MQKVLEMVLLRKKFCSVKEVLEGTGFSFKAKINYSKLHTIVRRSI